MTAALLRELRCRSPSVKVIMLTAHGTILDLAVLTRGEPGTGKELRTKAVRRASSRSDPAFVDVDCSGLEATTGETELATGLAEAPGAARFSCST